MRFPFVRFPVPPQQAFPTRTAALRPVVPIQLGKNGRIIRTFALLDTGADDCIFPASIAARLGITIPNQRSYVFTGSADDPQIAFFDVIRVAVLAWGSGEALLDFDLDAGFCTTLEHTGFGLLGQSGFFSRFKVTMDQSLGYFDIE